MATYRYAFTFETSAPVGSESRRADLYYALAAQVEDLPEARPLDLKAATSVVLYLRDDGDRIVAFRSAEAGPGTWQDPHGGVFSDEEQQKMDMFALGKTSVLVLDSGRSWLSLRLTVDVQRGAQ